MLAALLAGGALALERRDAPARPRVPVTLAAGTFNGLAQRTTGKATLVALADGRRKLRLERFATRAAPDLVVYLVEGGDRGGDITGGTEVGRLRSSSGEQEYVLPESAPAGPRVSVVIWCSWCSRPFGAAALTPV